MNRRQRFDSMNESHDIADVPADDPRPTPPERPLPGDCCQSGCNPCVFDLYQEALERYEAELRAWEARHAQPSGKRGR
ncbi:hypothetical protein AWB83_05413 [Caballeronia ptereochthonis]|uniref:Oxidoreductase-like domain-containing protein n=2 Tax=Caballeronia ptereochthonis TaxID=1777144 RepID=A0A158DFK6_9BURK|nr:hypothetical protein AWB83_05413 [Caballeronia ptereochthonis]